jgi:hypothetical protein
MQARDHIADIPRWTRPANYGGFSPDGDFLIYSTHRDADILTRSNWETIGTTLRQAAQEYPEPDNDGAHNQGGSWVYDFHARHWACGWVESLLIRSDAPAGLLETAAEILCAIASYPIFDESHFSEMEYTEARDRWARASVRERIDLAARAGVSIFSARGDDMPADCFDACLSD